MNKVKTLVSISAALVLLLSLAVPVAFGDEGTTTGSFTAANANPTITSVTLQESDKAAEASSMTPQTEYVVEIVAGDPNTIDSIATIDIHIFYDSDGHDDGTSLGAWDCDEVAIYKWTKAGGVWSRESGATTTTWDIVDANCDTPGTMTDTSGEWNLAFKPGKLAVEAVGGTGANPEWDVYVKE